MQLENFGEEAVIETRSSENDFSPLTIAVLTSAQLDFDGTPQTDVLLTEQCDVLKRRVNQYVGTALSNWLKKVNADKMVTRQYLNEGQCSAAKFAEDTRCEADVMDGFYLQVEVFLPGGIYTRTSEPIQELQSAMMDLRRKIAEEIAKAISQYAQKVDFRPADIDTSLFDVELELPAADDQAS